MYVKLFRSILNSTVWLEDDKTLRVWLTLLLLSEADGIVRVSIPGLAKEARVEVTEAKEALKKLEQPDPESQSQKEDGKRIIRLGKDTVWLIVNFSQYRKIKNSETRREYMREYMREYRKKNGDVNSCKPKLIQEEEESEEEKEKISCAESSSTLEPVFTFPVVGGTKKTWHLTQKKFDEYVETYPALDVHEEMRKALQWLRDNTLNQKTARGMTRFLGGWLGRAQNRGGRGSTSNPKDPNYVNPDNQKYLDLYK